jgi:hypothetical protein
MTTRRATGFGLVLFVTVVVLVGVCPAPITQQGAKGSSSHGGVLDSQFIIPGQGRAWKDDQLEEYRYAHCFDLLAHINPVASGADTAAAASAHCSAGGAQRMLLAKYQSLAQCQWLPGRRYGSAARVLPTAGCDTNMCLLAAGEGCAANSRFAAYALNRTKSDPVAQYAAASLSCVSITSKGELTQQRHLPVVCLLGAGTSAMALICSLARAYSSLITSVCTAWRILCSLAGCRCFCLLAAECQSPACIWDSTLGDGQQGCSLHPAKGMQLRQACMEPQYQDAFAQLQQCLAADRNCVCTRPSDPSSCTQPAGGSLCQSAAGCWLAALSGSTQDLLQLTSVQLSVVLPSLQTLWVDPTTPMPLLKASDVLGTTGRRRLHQQQQRALLGLSTGRHLLDVPSLSNPFVDIEQQQQGGGGKVVPESGRPSSGGAGAGGSFTSGLGQNIPISIEGTVPDTSTATIERDKSLSPAPGGGQLNPESGRQPSPGQQQPAAPTPAPVLRPEAGRASPAPAPGPSGAPTPAPTLPDVGGVRAQSQASPEFWKCVDDAAERADTTRKWADVDYNNKQLSLDTWLRVIQPVVSGTGRVVVEHKQYRLMMSGRGWTRPWLLRQADSCCCSGRLAMQLQGLLYACLREAEWGCATLLQVT